MPPRFQEMIQNLAIGTELIYAFVIIACCLMIYFATKKLYSLTKYKGIKYFRQAFLFFAVAYLFRFLIKFIILLFNSKNLFEIVPKIGGIFTTVLFMYFSSIAIFYLFYSIIWNKYNKKWIIPSLHALALIVPLVSILSNNLLIYLILNALIIILAIVLIIYTYNHKPKNKRISQLFLIYSLLLIFWIFNIIDSFVPNFLHSTKLLIYFISIGIFLTVLYKVLTKIGSK